MKTILITGHGGAAGAKTVTAGLVSALRVQGKSVVALDLCPGNLLRFHFGMNPEDERGLAHQILTQQPLEGANFRNRQGIDFIPFGSVTTEDYAHVLAWVNQYPEWLNQWISRLELGDEGVLVCHAPLSSHALWRHIIQDAQQLEIFGLDALTPTRMEQVLRCLPWLRTERSRWILNGFDATRRLDRDGELVVRQRYANRLLPLTMHRDEHHREALAQHTTIHAYAPSCQGAHDMTALALALSLKQTQPPGTSS